MTAQLLARREGAAAELQRRTGRGDAARIVDSLADGLKLLAEEFFVRIDRDVEDRFAMDSMLISPTGAAEVRAALRVKSLIDVFSIVVGSEEAVDRRYVDDQQRWLEPWLLSLRLEDARLPAVGEQVQAYRSMPVDERRRAFASGVERQLPRATRAPLVLYRLYPLAVRMVVAIAFGDHLRAGELRNEQTLLLPEIADCHDCHGRPLDNGERCATCGNPLWSFDWLNAAD
jgi:hypothetical protein